MRSRVYQISHSLHSLLPLPSAPAHHLNLPLLDHCLNGRQLQHGVLLQPLFPLQARLLVRVSTLNIHPNPLPMSLSLRNPTSSTFSKSCPSPHSTLVLIRLIEHVRIGTVLPIRKYEIVRRLVHHMSGQTVDRAHCRLVRVYRVNTTSIARRTPLCLSRVPPQLLMLRYPAIHSSRILLSIQGFLGFVKNAHTPPFHPLQHPRSPRTFRNLPAN